MMPWYPGDFQQSTRGWDFIERALYRELLDVQWDLGHLPPDDEKLRKMVGIHGKTWAKVRHKPFEKFPTGADGLRRNQRLEEHRQRALSIANQRSEAGKRGMENRWRYNKANSADIAAQYDPDLDQTRLDQKKNSKSAERAPPNGREGGAPARKGSDPALIAQLIEQERQQRERLFPGLAFADGKPPAETQTPPREPRAVPLSTPAKPMSPEEIEEKRAKVDAEMRFRMAQ